MLPTVWSPGGRATRTARIAASAASAPSGGETASAINVPSTPTGWSPSRPPQLTASAPPASSAAPTRPPTSAWPELEGSPSAHVIPFQADCRREAGSDDRYRLRWRHRDDAPDRVRNGSPDEQRTEQVAHRSEHDGRTRSRRARRDQGRDRVGGVVQPVGDGKGQRESHRDDEPRVHAGRLSGPPRGAAARRTA